jgi:hypothetical protein
MLAYLYHYFGDVGLSIFPKYIGNAVKAQGWNKIEDHLVTAGKEALDQVLAKAIHKGLKD